MGRPLLLIALCFRAQEFKELEVLVLRHELAILRRQVAGPALRPADRTFLAAASQLMPRERWSSFFVTPDTLLRWLAIWLRGAGPFSTGADLPCPRAPP